MEQNPEPMETELDLSQLLKILWNRWYIILLALLGVLTLTSIYAYVFQDDVYTARVTFAVRWDDTDVNPATGFQLAERLVNSYVEFSTSKIVLDDLHGVLETKYGYDFSNLQLREMIETTGRGNTIVLDILVTHTDPLVASRVADELIDVIDGLTKSDEIQNLQVIDIWGKAEGEAPLSGPNRLLYCVIGLVLGLMVGVFTVFLIEFFDKTIKTTRDIEKKLQLRVLGVIPNYELEDSEVLE